MAGLSLRHVHKVIGKQTIVKDLSLDITDGEFIVFLGPSGCGKSTTLRMIAGLEEATSGDIFIGNSRVNDIEAKDRNVAMVFQSYALYPHMNVYDNIAFALKIAGNSKSEIHSKVNKVAEILHLTDLLKRKPSALSGGQRQRVAMGRAMVRDPHVFLFDEPLSNLDSKLRAKMREELREIHKMTKKTTIYVTHDQVEAMTLADRIIIMQQGIITQIGTPTEVFLKPANIFVAEFIGSPAMNFMEMNLIEESGKILAQRENIKIDVSKSIKKDKKSKDKVLIGFRPTDISFYNLNNSSSAKISTLIKSCEVYGADVVVGAQAGNSMFNLQVPLNQKPNVGETIDSFLSLNAIHIFDVDTGNSLTSTN